MADDVVAGSEVAWEGHLGRHTINYTMHLYKIKERKAMMVNARRAACAHVPSAVLPASSILNHSVPLGL